MQQFKKKTVYLGPTIILFTKDIKMWTIHLYILEIFVILQLKKQKGDVLKHDTELCPFCYFPVIIVGKEEAKFLCKFL